MLDVFFIYLFCLVLFFFLSSSIATSVIYFFPGLLVVHMPAFIFGMISPCITVSLIIYFPLLTALKASLFVLVSEHQGSSSFACNLFVMTNYSLIKVNL